MGGFLCTVFVFVVMIWHGSGMDPRPLRTNPPRVPTTGTTNTPPLTSPGINLELQRLTAQVQILEGRLSLVERNLQFERQRREAFETRLVGDISRIESGRQGAGQPAIHSGAPPSRDPVAFSSSVKANNGNLVSGQTLLFGHVPTNIGGAFNFRSGKFRCPLKGLYHFWVTINSIHHEGVVTELVVNGKRRYLTHSVENPDVAGATGSTSVYLVLEASDSVWVRILNGTGIVPWWTNFNGLLISPL